MSAERGNMFLYFVLGFAVLACLGEVYLLVSYVRCQGKYPPFINSFGKVREDILQKAEEILQREKEAVKVVDLGCGSGSLLIPLAKKFPHHQFYGYEWDWLPFFLISRRVKNLPNVFVYRKNFMKEDLRDYKLLLCNVGNGIEQELGQKLKQEISAEAVVLSEFFPLSFLREKKVYLSKLYGLNVKIFLYMKN